MHIAALALSILLALAMLMSGALKFFPTERITRLMAAVGVSGRALAVLGGLQVAATIGLLSGLWFTPFGIAAATGLILYFAGAIIAHVRSGDPDWQGAASFLAMSAATLTVLLLDA